MTIELRLLREPTARTMADLAAVLAGAPAYFRQCTGKAPQPGDAAVMLAELPPGCRADQKYFFAIHAGDEMIGCADVIRGWPTQRHGHIGLLLLSEAHQGRGCGKRAFAELCRCLAGWPEVTTLRIAVVEANERALRFWRGAGFKEAGARVASDRFSAALVILERPLAPAP